MNENQNNFREDLLAYLDGELDPARRTEVELALDENPALREELAELSAHADILRQTPAMKAPEELWGRIEKDIAIPRRILSPVFVRVAALAAAACLVVVVGVKMLPGTPKEITNPQPPPKFVVNDRDNILKALKPSEQLKAFEEFVLTEIINADLATAHQDLELMEKIYQDAGPKVNGQWQERINELRILLTNPYGNN